MCLVPMKSEEAASVATSRPVLVAAMPWVFQPRAVKYCCTSASFLSPRWVSCKAKQMVSFGPNPVLDSSTEGGHIGKDEVESVS